MKYKYRKITSKKPYFDKNGNFCILSDIKFGGEIKPELKPLEWVFFLFEISDKKLLTQKKINLLYNLIGSKQTIYRIKKSLKNKGYIQ